ncbi:clavaminate synthase-like protein At3g21360 [Quercus suber]|uniref:Clavaminate synthase-like protein n=1 Tax=Quercus suber TaxID=58331 RepID=A0AAW0M3P9_QUESU|nr:clavaminate synthase-like protein At3g21360 [Quercus suber]XP_023875895.1 clavaminate synthase-like protein At3g21360 [Quercus suber]POE81885.1 clavaminate synthase-like protein [Quercus suber]POE81890.1 clavaminate synthase-like protein [Quercus suber]
MSETFLESQIPHQKLFNGIQFPLVLSPNPKSQTPPSSLSLFTQAIKTEKTFLDSVLHKSGAVLLRGFPVNTASDFNDVVEAFGFEELPYVGGAAPRSNVVGRVFTTNDSPPDQKVPFHHEMAQVTTFPSKLFFFCEVEPGSGGETPIVLSHLVYEKMKERHPEFVEQLEEHGLLYTRVIGEDDDLSSPIGRGWKSTFLTKDKSVAEERAANVGTKLEWLEDSVKTIMGPLPAIKFDKTRQRKIWFNSMIIAYIGWEDARNDPVKAVTFGDGKPLPADIVYDCLNILEEESVAFPWQKGDVLLLDNWAALHARKSFAPPRRILASLCK